MTIPLLLTALLIPSAQAHVKWFSNYDFIQPPLALSEIATPTFWGLLLLSLVSLPLLVWLDSAAGGSRPYRRMNGFLDRYKDEGPLIIRVTMGAVLLMSWQGNAMVAPEIAAPGDLWVWAQLVMALLLLFRETAPLTGLGMIVLYGVALAGQGVFHMLDYVVYPAVGLYLFLTHLKDVRWRNLDLPVLYSGLGFSLCWVAFEKLFYPYWGRPPSSNSPSATC